jgi:hypothetical protein
MIHIGGLSTFSPIILVSAIHMVKRRYLPLAALKMRSFFKGGNSCIVMLFSLISCSVVVVGLFDVGIFSLYGQQLRVSENINERYSSTNEPMK